MIASISRNFASSLIALVASASLLAGCNGDDTGATNTDSASTTNPTTTVAESDSTTSATDTTTESATDSTSETTTSDLTGTTTTGSTGSTCGDGTVDDGEQCDDGNNDDGDGCAADCTSEGDSMCDPYTQDCPDGQKCTSSNAMAGDFWNINICIEVMGNQTEGSSCTVLGDEPGGGIDDCDVGLICLFADEEGMNGTCTAFCTGDPDNGMCEGAKAFCVPANDGFLPICLNSCDPLLQDCPFDHGCYGDSEDGSFLCFKPDPKEGGMDNDNCAFDNACLPGFQCLPPEVVAECEQGFDGCCNPFCALDGDSSECNLNAGEVCSAFYMEDNPPWDNVGICTLP